LYVVKLNTHAVVVVKMKRYTKYLKPPASAVNTLDAAKHGKYIITNIINDSAIGIFKFLLKISFNELLESSASPTEYNTPKVDTTTSFAANPASKATLKRQSKPRGAKNGSVALPICPK